jgi:hypothetical protein
MGRDEKFERWEHYIGWGRAVVPGEAEKSSIKNA